ANKAELLTVLAHPDVPLHTNGSENDIRCQVTKRKISGGTRSDLGRDCRDAFLGLATTCAKLGIAFWNYLASRLAVPDQLIVPVLVQVARCPILAPSGGSEGGAMVRLLGLDDLFEGRHFDREIIVLCVRWYPRFKRSFRDLAEMMAERGVSIA